MARNLELGSKKSLTTTSEKRKSWIGKKTTVALVSLTALASLGTAGAIFAQKTDRSFDFPKIFENISKSQDSSGKPTDTLPSAFDNSLDGGVISDNNVARLTSEEIDKLYPSPFEKINDGKNTIQLLFPLQVDFSNSGNTEISYAKFFTGSSLKERQQYNEKGLFDTITFYNVPGGTAIISPVDGYLSLSIPQDQNLPPNGADNTGVTINFTSPDGNQYRITIAGSTLKEFDDGQPNRNTAFIFRSLIQAPVFSPDDNGKVIGEYGIFVERGTPILQLISRSDKKPIEEVSISQLIARQGKVGEPINMNKPSIPTNFDLLVDRNRRLVSASTN